MNKEELIGKLQMCYFGERNAFEEIVSVYEELIKENEKLNHYKLLNQKVKDRNDKAINYIKENVDENNELCLFEDEIDKLLEILKGNNEE